VKLYSHSHLYNPLASMQDNRINNILDYNGHRVTHTQTVRHISKEEPDALCIQSETRCTRISTDCQPCYCCHRNTWDIKC